MFDPSFVKWMKNIDRRIARLEDTTRAAPNATGRMMREGWMSDGGFGIICLMMIIAVIWGSLAAMVIWGN